MKKRVSLFLALLMVFSVLFATSAEAAQIEPTVDVQSEILTSVVTARKEVNAPCVTDLDQPGDSTMGAVTPGGGTTPPCTHKYRTDPYSASQHKRTCTKCGYSYYASHSFGLVPANGSYHNKVCNYCGYTTYGGTHQYNTYTDHTAYHVKSCVCGYSVKENHRCEEYLQSGYHMYTCAQGKCSDHIERHTREPGYCWCKYCKAYLPE